jgi:hypothetical protein
MVYLLKIHLSSKRIGPEWTRLEQIGALKEWPSSQWTEDPSITICMTTWNKLNKLKYPMLISNIYKI